MCLGLVSAAFVQLSIFIYFSYSANSHDVGLTMWISASLCIYILYQNFFPISFHSSHFFSSSLKPPLFSIYVSCRSNQRLKRVMPSLFAWFHIWPCSSFVQRIPHSIHIGRQEDQDISVTPTKVILYCDRYLINGIIQAE